MRVHLLHRDHDLTLRPELQDGVFDAMMSGNPYAVLRARRDAGRTDDDNSHPALDALDRDLIQDLELQTLWSAMAAGDDFLYETAVRVTLSGLDEPDAIAYRQAVLRDCLAHSDVVTRIYALALEALEGERKVGGVFWRTNRPSTTLHTSVQLLTLLVDVLKRLRQLADQYGPEFQSEGFGRFFARLRDELSDDYLEQVEQHLRDLAFKDGLLESATLGKSDKGTDYQVRRTRVQRWIERLGLGSQEPSYSFTIAPRDQAGFDALDELRSHGLNHLANAAARSAEHVKSFFTVLRFELAFYLACVNLDRRLQAKGLITCFPEPTTSEELSLSADGLYDVCLALYLDQPVVGNRLAADGKSLIMITGANQGGKSTLLRGLGLAQLMMQAGMIVGAASFRASVCAGTYTHFKREEDAAMEGGKLDEELGRMSRIADLVTPRSLLLCNESFASTNEREGSEIARQVVRAMLECRIRVVFVTHMYDLAHGLHEEQSPSMLFLRAERQPDGQRTFRLPEAEPLPTSYGEDSYRLIFGDSAPNPAATAAAALKG